jgi:phage-related protein (TIGR01555 family)
MTERIKTQIGPHVWVYRSAPPPPPPPVIDTVGEVSRADSSSGSSLALCPTGVEVSAAAWGNASSGLGIAGLDPTRSLSYGGGRIPSAYVIDRLYTFDWLAKRIIELLPRIAMVRGFSVAGPDRTSDIALIRRFRALNYTERFPRGAFERAVNDGRAYGGSVLLLGYANGNPASELTPAQAAGGINFLDVFGQHELRALTRYEDPSQGNFAMPELYQVIAGTSGPPHPRVGQIFHASRAIRFSGNPLRVPNTAADLVGDYPEIGVSVLTDVMNVIAQYGLAWSAMSNMLQDASIGVMKLGGFVEGVAGEDKDLIRDRLQVLQMTKSVHRMMFLDADNNEDYTRTEVTMTDVDKVIQQFMVAVAGAAGVPARIFFSSSPSGLNANASGNSDLSQFYADCGDYQNTYIGPKLEATLTAIKGGVAGGEGEGGVKVEWPSLWEASDNEKAQTRLAQANTDKVYWDMGFGAKQIAKARAAGTFIELTGEAPEDGRDDVAGAGQPDPGAGPAGAPGAEGASKIATKQRANETAAKK